MLKLLDAAYLTTRTTGLVLAWGAAKAFRAAIALNQMRAAQMPIKIVEKQ